MDTTKPKDLKTWAYESIKDLIINNQFSPGTQLRVEELENNLNISRTPIREALLSLQTEGLIEIKSRVGFFVKGITKKEFNDLFEMRELLEVFAIKKAVRKISDQDLERLVELDRESEKILKKIKAGNLSSTDAIQFLKYEDEIHAIIIARAENQNLSYFLEKIHDLISREKMISIESSDNVLHSIEEHHDIIEAIKKKDARLSGKAMGLHISNVKNRIKNLFKFDEKYDE